MAGYFEVYRDKKQNFRFRLKADNGEIIAVSEGYKSKQSCLKGVESIRQNAGTARVIELDFDRDLLEYATRGDVAGVRKAIQAGARLTTKDSVGNTAMHLAVLSGNDKTVQALLNAGVKTNARNQNGKTPIQLAQAKSYTNIISLLVD